jgi:hypothetical protein
MVSSSARHRSRRATVAKYIIVGNGYNTAAMLIPELGDPARFESTALWQPTSACAPDISSPASIHPRANR